MSFAFLCFDAGTGLLLMLAALIIVALPLAMGAGFVSALIKLMRELIEVRKR
ncbi:MAG: hypothetical protein WKF30_11375 [Pyrinomonadaceae bacterium]